MPPEPWDDIRDAVDVRRPPRSAATPASPSSPSLRCPGDATLNVNVFTPVPGEPGAALPVLVYIHGGGYTAGSPASPWYDGRAFNRDGVVTVTISYRLGFDGFGHIAGAPSNRGVRDWLAALEWVRDNIAAFGGDPSRVTIAGQSAGGGAVLTLLGMPVAQHLFHAVWALSGALADIAPERARTFSARLANLAGVAPTREGFASVPEERLLRAAGEGGVVRRRPDGGRSHPARRGPPLGSGDRRRAHSEVHTRVAARRRRRRQAARARRHGRRVHHDHRPAEGQAAVRACRPGARQARASIAPPARHTWRRTRAPARRAPRRSSAAS